MPDPKLTSHEKSSHELDAKEQLPRSPKSRFNNVTHRASDTGGIDLDVLDPGLETDSDEQDVWKEEAFKSEDSEKVISYLRRVIQDHECVTSLLTTLI